MGLSDQLRSIRLTTAERRVAEVMLGDLERVAFGTVADLAKLSGTGGATVMRLAAKAGFDGFSELQDSVRSELSRRLRPAVERIREPAAGDRVNAVLHAEVANLQKTIGAVEPAVLDEAVSLLQSANHVAVLAADAASGVGSTFAADLGFIRRGVQLIDGGEVAVARRLSRLGPGDVLVAIDVRRYDRLVVDATRRAATAGVAVIALTDSMLSPLAAVARASFVFSADGVGPFDSYVGALALVNVLVASLTALANDDVVAHLDRVEAAWEQLGAYVEQ
jgi:DNA-binding MurR/RpiR family transcriptional regulator